MKQLLVVFAVLFGMNLEAEAQFPSNSNGMKAGSEDVRIGVHRPRDVNIVLVHSPEFGMMGLISDDVTCGIIDVGDLPDGIIDVGDLPDGIIDVGDLPDGIIDVGDLPDGLLDPQMESCVLNMISDMGGQLGIVVDPVDFGEMLRLFKAPDGGAFEDISRSFGLG